MLAENKNSIHFRQNSSKEASLTRSRLSCKDSIKGNIQETSVKVWTRLYSCRTEFNAGLL